MWSNLGPNQSQPPVCIYVCVSVLLVCECVCMHIIKHCTILSVMISKYHIKKNVCLKKTVGSKINFVNKNYGQHVNSMSKMSSKYFIRQNNHGIRFYSTPKCLCNNWTVIGCEFVWWVMKIKLPVTKIIHDLPLFIRLIKVITISF